ncbi:hypothetical protein F1188_02250 [Roseospira marina]|uniref:Uncharacterized protein n=1 Tax=Roseospira marina TaxID=140057 RepID=A0A5M6IH19_9PROT|nr:hypothetical protein [Roseospira marina]KAA5607601.1 hypothetical protein F1188_02250 [Roseospira marina]MBB4312204.1 hypothetical protein [Roseospira marina]MBB5085780.1 hypothetical protein [Roseospira marina]
MHEPILKLDGPFAAEAIARHQRDVYMAHLIRAGVRRLMARLSGTPARAEQTTAGQATDAVQPCYVREHGLTTMPDADTIAARSSNDPTTRDSRAA